MTKEIKVEYGNIRFKEVPVKEYEIKGGNIIFSKKFSKKLKKKRIKITFDNSKIISHKFIQMLKLFIRKLKQVVCGFLSFSCHYPLYGKCTKCGKEL